jgi:hypothetical protein
VIKRAAALCAIALLPRLAHAQNGLVNPSFDASVTGWNHFGVGSASWDPANDAAGDARSGALLLSLPGRVGAVAAGQCVPVTVRSGTSVGFGAQAKLHHTGPVFPAAFVRIGLWQDAACTVPLPRAEGDNTPNLTAVSGWQPLTHVLVVSQDVGGVQLDCVLQPNASPDPQGVDFDEAFLVGSGIQAPPAAVFSLSLPAMLTLTLLLMAVGVLALRSSAAA